ncbi:MAG TPA: hypothetical protein VHE30_24955 [Polyangiaceae bacterium]|nr:hypothetical protein [Polyangiaceae bacterium]
MASEAELRKAARANAEVRVFRAGEEEAAADADALYWARIPVDQRAEFVWKLSLELHALAHPDRPYDPGLSRSTARIVGR